MAVKLGILGLLAWLVLLREPNFQSNLRIWGEAAIVNDTAPRPAYNLGILWRLEGAPHVAVAYFAKAWNLSRHRPEQDAMTAKIRAQIQFLEMFGTPVCEQSSPQPFC